MNNDFSQSFFSRLKAISLEEPNSTNLRMENVTGIVSSKIAIHIFGPISILSLSGRNIVGHLLILSSFRFYFPSQMNTLYILCRMKGSRKSNAIFQNMTLNGYTRFKSGKVFLWVS